MFRRTTFAASLPLWLLISLCAGFPANAQQRVFSVPRTPLDQALRQLAAQGGVQILYMSEDIHAHESAPVSGRYEAEEAFSRALQGSGFSVARIDLRTFVVRKVAQPHTADATPPSPPKEAPEPPLEVVINAHRIDILKRPVRAQDGRLDFDADRPLHTLSRDNLQSTRAGNAVETLAQVPGVTLITTGRGTFGGVDSASRAEGLFTAVHGVNAEFNVTQINGVDLASGTPDNRGVKLALLPPAGFSHMVMTTSSSPDMDGDATGATIRLYTPSSLDFSESGHSSLSLSSRLDDRAQAYGRNGAGYGFNWEWAQRLAQGRFGLYANVYGDTRRFANSEFAGITSATNDAGYALRYQGMGLAPQDNLIETGLDAGVSVGTTRRSGGSLAIDLHLSDTMDLSFRATRARADTQQNSTLSQIAPVTVSYVQRPDLGKGVSEVSVDQVSTRVWYETNPETQGLDTTALALDWRKGLWRVRPALTYSLGIDDQPDRIEASIRVNQLDRFNKGQPRDLEGQLVSYDAKGYAVAQITPEIFADLDEANTRLLARRSGQRTVELNRQSKTAFQLDAERRFNGSDLDMIKLGLKVLTTEFDSQNRDWTNDHFANLLGQGGLTWADLGISNSYYAQAFPGHYSWRLPKVDHDALVGAFERYKTDASFDTCGTVYANNLNCNTQWGRETVASAYVMARWRYRAFEVLSGVRFEDTSVRNRFWVLPLDDTGAMTLGHFADNSSHFKIWLPSLFVNYRPSNALVLRADVWRSYTRPAFEQLAGGTRTTVTSGVKSLESGNPDLLPVRALNADLSAQLRLGQDGQISLMAFHKALSDYLFEAGKNAVNPSDIVESGLLIRKPTNGGKGLVNGLELELNLARLANTGVGRTLGVRFNIDHQWTRVDLGSDELGRKKPIQNAPEWQGSFHLIWQYRGTRAGLDYTYTSDLLSNYNALSAPGSWDDKWVRARHTVDANLNLKLNAKLSLDIAANNLTNGPSYWAHIGRKSLVLSDIIESGRSFAMKMVYSF